MRTPRPLAALLALAIATGLSLAEDLATCGAASYYPSEHTCYNDSALCPIINSLPTTPCGSNGCYKSQEFSCEDGKLKSLPKADGPFTLTVHGTRETYRNMTVKACGNYLAVGANARECTSCNGTDANVDCSTYGRRTVLLASGQMAVDIPGGQYWFVHPSDGSLRFTEGGANDTQAESFKDWIGKGVTVLENGFFVYQDEPHYWLACLRTLPGGTVGTGRTWRLYAPTFSNLQKDCEPVRIVAHTVDRKVGAYKYE